MKNAFATTAIAAILVAGMAGAASAMPYVNPSSGIAASAPVELAGHKGKQFRKGKHFILPQHVVVRSLRKRGFRHIRNVRLRHGDYVLNARGHRGPVRLVVDGRTARILARQPLYGWHRPGFSLHGHGQNFSYSFGFR